MVNDIYCPCTPKHLYRDCCQVYHNHIQSPINAEQLMRSRYSAYVFNLTDYLINTWHPTTCPKLSMNESAAVVWIKLIINRSWEDNANNTAFVDFDAFYEQGGTLQRMHEVSRFIQQDGLWLYVDGELS